MQVQSSVLCAAKPLSPPARVRAITTTTANDPSSMATTSPKWAQKTITLPPLRRGCHLITPKVFMPNHHILVFGFLIAGFVIHGFWPFLRICEYFIFQIHSTFKFLLGLFFFIICCEVFVTFINEDFIQNLQVFLFLLWFNSKSIKLSSFKWSCIISYGINCASLFDFI